MLLCSSGLGQRVLNLAVRFASWCALRLQRSPTEQRSSHCRPSMLSRCAATLDLAIRAVYVSFFQTFRAKRQSMGTGVLLVFRTHRQHSSWSRRCSALHGQTCKISGAAVTLCPPRHPPPIPSAATSSVEMGWLLFGSRARKFPPNLAHVCKDASDTLT